MTYQMSLAKRLAFAPLFLIVFAIACALLPNILQASNLFAIFELKAAVDLALISGLLILSSLLFAVFAVLASKWKFVLPANIVAAVLPLILVPGPVGIILGISTIFVFSIAFALIQGTLSSYIDFRPAALFASTVRNTTVLIMLAICVSYFYIADASIQQNGFHIPDSLINIGLSLSGVNSSSLNPSSQDSSAGSETSPLDQIKIPQEQIELLKQNPELLKQYGLDPSLLDSFAPTTTKSPASKSAPSSSPAKDFIKQTINTQVESMLKPYMGLIAPIMALLLFSTFLFFVSILGILIKPILWLIFFIMQKTKFISYTTEMREVKKLIV